jgi:hypothetical protein
MKATDRTETEAIPRRRRVRALTAMTRKGPWSPRPLRRAVAAAAAARRASGTEPEEEGSPRLLEAAAAGRRVVPLLPPPVIGEISAISPLLVCLVCGLDTRLDWNRTAAEMTGVWVSSVFSLLNAFTEKRFYVSGTEKTLCTH